MLIKIDFMPTERSTWFDGLKWAEYHIQNDIQLEHTFEMNHRDGTVSDAFFEGAYAYELHHKQFKDQIDRRFINEDSLQE